MANSLACNMATGQWKQTGHDVNLWELLASIIAPVRRAQVAPATSRTKAAVASSTHDESSFRSFWSSRATTEHKKPP